MSEKKGSPKIDGVVVLCVLIIILLVLVCVLPPVFRLIQSNESNPVPTQTPENKFNGTLMCQKEEDRQGIMETTQEVYQYQDDQLTTLTHRTVYTNSDASLSKEQLLNTLYESCNEKKIQYQNTLGLNFTCEKQIENNVVLGLSTEKKVIYHDLTLNDTESIIPFTKDTQMEFIKETREASSYTCTIQ